MGKLILPMAPWEKRHRYTRFNEEYEAVKGYSEDGLMYGYHEKVALHKGIYKARLMPTRKCEYLEQGKLHKIEIYWAWHYFNSVTDELEKVDNECHVDVQYADQIYFSAQLGEPIMNSMLNGAIKGRPMGFNTQPVIDFGTGEWIPDEVLLADGTRDEDNSYDTSLAPDPEAYERDTKPRYEPDPEPEAEPIVEAE